MNFAVSQILGGVLAPGNFLLIVLIFGFFLLKKREKLGRWLLRFCILGFLAIAVLPLGSWLAAPLENRFPSSPLPAHVDGIIVLGGGVQPRSSEGRPVPSLNDRAERMTEFVYLLRHYPRAKGVFTGGSGLLINNEAKEAGIAKQVFDRLGVSPKRILYESESRTTYENVLLSQKLVKPKLGEVWVLVTSAFHMPRAVGVFRKLNWNVQPYPCDYATPLPNSFWLDFNLRAGLVLLDLAVHEYLGLLAYYIQGHTSSLFPGPEAT